MKERKIKKKQKKQKLAYIVGEFIDIKILEIRMSKFGNGVVDVDFYCGHLDIVDELL